MARKPTDKELSARLSRQVSALKDVLAVIKRDYSASRMNATKWRETVETLGDLGLFYRFRWVNVENISKWMGIFLPHSESTYYDSDVGPFKTVEIEWMEIDTTRRSTFVQYHGTHIIIEDMSSEIEKRLDSIQVPYFQEGDNIRIIGYVRNSAAILPTQPDNIVAELSVLDSSVPSE